MKSKVSSEEQTGEFNDTNQAKVRQGGILRPGPESVKGMPQTRKV
jgi:hypothetical protein